LSRLTSTESRHLNPLLNPRAINGIMLYDNKSAASVY